ncbi:MAG: O-antigen ligase family protein [Bacteroidales bacterium]|nr:O-antigen ligase family protein [Bacteroidales bacterium]
MQSLFGKQSNNIYIGLLALCTILTLWGNFVITVCCILLTIFWVCNGNYTSTFSTLFSRKSSLFLSIICALILFRPIIQLPEKEALQFIVSKLPFLIYLLVIGGQRELNPKQFHNLMLLFVAGVVANTLYSFGCYLANLTDTLNFRAIGVFMSHIRLLLFTIVAAAVCVHYLFFDTEFTTKGKTIFLAIALCWLLFFIIFSKTLIAYLIVCILLVILGFILAYRHNSFSSAIALIVGICFILLFFCVLLYSECRYFIYPDNISVEQLETQTSRGNEYTHNFEKKTIENGHKVYIYMCDTELDSCWKAKTGYSIHDKDALGYSYLHIICRYMASKNLRKDADGFAQLTDDDIENILEGFSNYRFTTNLSISKRIYESFWEIHEYLNGGNPNGHSITQRLEFHKCALETIKKFPWFGTGGLIRSEMFKTYEETNSPLARENWNLPHNQFLHIAVTTGLFGLLAFLICICCTLIYTRNKWNAITASWFIAMLISFFSEDTLNTHAGLVFCVFLGSLILFAQPEKQK